MPAPITSCSTSPRSKKDPFFLLSQSQLISHHDPEQLIKQRERERDPTKPWKPRVQKQKELPTTDFTSSFRTLKLERNPINRITSAILIKPWSKSFSTSPRILMAYLQHELRRLPPLWKGMARRYDSAAEETVRERRAAIESGRLKGRRLFGVPDSGDGEAEICSGWSGLTDDDDDDDGCCDKIKKSEEVVAAEYGGCSSSSSSSSPPLCIGKTEKKMKKRNMVRGRWIGIVSVLLVVAIVALRSCASGHGSEGHMNPIPT